MPLKWINILSIVIGLSLAIRQILLLYCSALEFSSLTGWLKIKYPSRQCAIFPQLVADFKNSWSCLILSLLRVEQYTDYTMYPPHLNYTITLPCKTMTMKNHNFRNSACIEIKSKHRLLQVRNSAIYFWTFLHLWLYTVRFTEVSKFKQLHEFCKIGQLIADK